MTKELIKNEVLIAMLFLLMGLHSLGATPPDSTTRLAEKLIASYLVEDGKQLFMEGKVRDALNRFRDASRKDPTSSKAPLWMGMCYYEQYHYRYAHRYLNDAIKLNNNQIDKELYEVLGEAYHRLGIIDSAIVYYQTALSQLSKKRIAELNIDLHLQHAEYAQKLLAKKQENKRQPLNEEINTEYNDYSPVAYQNGKALFFTSRRSNTTGGGQNPLDQQYFEDIYGARWNDKTNQWDSITNRLGRLNGPGFESMSHITEDGSTAYITINNTAIGKASIISKSSDIAEVKMTNQDKWAAPRLIAEVNSSYYDGNATLTADGQTMYFISEREGQKKKSDIYVSHKQGNVWSKPVALPKDINTTERETTPFITPDGRYLFFSSNGHANSMGGYDVYVVERISDHSWGEVQNLGATINTVNDDFGFKLYDNIKKAYINGINVESDRPSLDIYEFNTSLEEILKNVEP